MSVKNIALAGLVIALVAMLFGTPLESAVVGSLILLIAISMFALGIGVRISLDPWAGELRRRGRREHGDADYPGGDDESDEDDWDFWGGGDGGGGDGGGGE